MISPHTAQEPRREKQLSARARKEKGTHYTPDELAAFVAEQIIGHLPAGKKLRILDPAVGDGALLQSLASKLGNGHHYEGFDVDAPALDLADKLLGSAMQGDSYTLNHSDFLARYGGADDDFFHSAPTPEYDAAISNPPYVRTQVLGASAAQRLASVFNHTGRVDLCFAFLACITLAVKPRRNCRCHRFQPLHDHQGWCKCPRRSSS